MGLPGTSLTGWRAAGIRSAPSSPTPLLPLIAYAIGDFAILTHDHEEQPDGNLSADYVRTAVAKGLPFRKAVTDHAMRNSLIPIASHLGSVLTVSSGAPFLIETIFNIDGIGLLGYEAIVETGLPTVAGHSG